MYEFHRMLTNDLHRERMQEADRSRLASLARRSGGATIAERIRGRLAVLVGQPAAAVTPFSTDAPACGL
jgi:hypothetical protein